MPRFGLLLTLTALLFGLLLVNSHDLSDQELLEYQPPAEILENFRYYLSGYDEDGAPVWIWEFGKWDFRSYIEGGKDVEELDKAGDQLFLRFQQSARNGTEKTGFVNIMDLEGFSLTQASHSPTVQYIISKFRKFQDIIKQGDLKAGYLVNTNAVFQTIWDLGKPLLGELSAHVQVFGNNKDKWIPVLLKTIPKSQLPEFYGGAAEHKPIVLYG